MLDRYKNLSSKIEVNYVDPDKKPDIARVEGMRNSATSLSITARRKKRPKA